MAIGNGNRQSQQAMLQSAQQPFRFKFGNDLSLSRFKIGSEMFLEPDVEPARALSALKRGQSSLVLDCEEPCTRRARRASPHTADAGSPAGPATVVALFLWAQQYWQLLRVRGQGCFNLDLAAALLRHISLGLRIHTDYSGMGGPEEAMHQILLAAMELFPGDLGSLVKFVRGGDNSPSCRHVLLGRIGPCAPECVFGDLTARCPPHLLAKAKQLAHRYKLKAYRAIRGGREKKDAIRSYGLMFLAKAAMFMLDVDSPSPHIAHCFRHNKFCSSRDDHRPSGFAGLSGCIAGINCYDWSSMGGAGGWCGPSAIIFLCFLREVVLNAYDWLILECTALFDEDGLAPLRPWYRVVTLKFSPVLLGFPVSRMRKYMLLTRHGVLKWRCEIESAGHMNAFKAIFAQTVCLEGVDLARAPQEKLEEMRQHMIKKRSLPATRSSGKPWGFYHLLSGSLRASVLQHEKTASAVPGSRPRMVCNPGQRSSFLRCTSMVPALLRRSLLWSMLARRPFHSEEHLEIMGYNMFGPECCSCAEVLRALPETEQRSIAGNGMHAAAIGSAVMFLLSGVDRQ